MKKQLLFTCIFLLTTHFTFSQWTQVGADIDGEALGDLSGGSVSLSSDGTIVAIGATGNDGNTGNISDNRGHVRIFQWDGVSWILQQEIDGEATQDGSGFSVSLSSDGTTLAVGATRNDHNGTDSGHVRIYQWDGMSWNQIGQDLDGEAAADRSSYSISLSNDGNRVAIGAIFNDGVNGSDSGHVRVYQFDGITWNQLGQDIDGEAAGDRFGRSVSLSADGSILAIGAYENDGNGNNSGHIRIYGFDGAVWNQLGQDLDGESTSDRFGESVSISADGATLAVGASWNDGVNGINSGHVQVFFNPELKTNVFVGNQSGANTTGDNNTFLGDYSGTTNTEGNNNSFTGYRSGYSNTTGNYNTANGTDALYTNSTGSNNVAIGSGALQNNLTGSNNTAIGFNARVLFNSATNSTAIGNGALAFGSNQVRIGNFSVVSIGGYEPWSHLSDGRFKKNIEEDIPGVVFIKKLRPVSYQIDQSKLQAFLGEENATSLSNKKAIGFIAQEVEQIVKENNYVFTGIEQPQHENDHYRIRYSEFVVPLVKAVQEQQQFIKTQRQLIESLQEELASFTHTELVSENTRNQPHSDKNGTVSDIFSNKPVNLSSDGSIRATGTTANYISKTNTENLTMVVSPQNNVFVGYKSGANTTGNNNTFLGDYSGFRNTEGNNNSFTGYQSGYSNITGNYNTANGVNALYTNSTGNNNVAIGSGALHNNLIGSNNTAIGYNARTFQNNLVNTTTIGNGALALGSNQVRIGNSSISSIGGYAPWSHLSDGRFKKNIKEDIPGMEFIKKLRPVSYQIDQSKLQAFLREENSTTPTNKKAIGFIAQEVEQIVKENNYVFTGIEQPQHENDHYRIRYSEFVVPLVKAIQEQQELVETHQQKIDTIQQEITAFTNKNIQTTKSITSLPEAVGLEDTLNKNALPEGFVLEQNIPNPFNETTTIMAELPATINEAKIVIYNLQGIALQSYPLIGRGRTAIEIKGGSLPSGMYLYALLADGQLIATKKMILTK